MLKTMFLGDGTVIPSSVPKDITANSALLQGNTITSISAGLYHSIALTDAGKLISWGKNVKVCNHFFFVYSLSFSNIRLILHFVFDT